MFGMTISQQISNYGYSYFAKVGVKIIETVCFLEITFDTGTVDP